jgi:pilus assembly protein Flp/PilA
LNELIKNNIGSHDALFRRDWTRQGQAMTILLETFCKDEQGATAIEYGLIAAGISIAIITAVASLGSTLNTTFTSVSTALK